MKTPVEKLLWKEFKIKGKDDLFTKIELISEEVIANSTQITKQELLRTCTTFIKKIDSDGHLISESRDMVADGSIAQGWAMAPYAYVMNRYKANRKSFVALLKPILL
jgi:hypothetical protein